MPRSRIILNLHDLLPGDMDSAYTLTHEVAHVATQRWTWAGAPAWLVEGAAEYTATRSQPGLPVLLPPSLRRQVANGSVYLPTYDFYERQVAAHYVVGYLACAYISDRFGESTLRRYYRELAETPSELMTGDRTRRVTRRLLGMTTEELEQRVARYAAGLSH